MAILHFRTKERRRTLRVSITVPIAVHGQDENGDKFRVKAKSESVNRHGALLSLDQPVVVGQMLILVNENSDRTVECRVVSVKRDRENRPHVGVEFTSPDSNFWHMSFPLPGSKPLRRAIDTKASA
ncbi:MAG TPA: PilZ domain-containing protein [Candidatus Methylomirabilis sp.]|nr:PilZ domain-containing protein [Candidatus Methylomirabilis sp.]